MNNIFFVTYCNLDFFNGVGTYDAFIESTKENHNQVKIHHISLNTPKIGKIKKEIKEDGIIYISVPNDLVAYGIIENNDIKVIDEIIAMIGRVENVIFHFNWINHALLSPLLKKKIKCKTILTLHYMYWRDFMLSDYRLFYKINTSFINNKNLPFSYKRKIGKEILHCNTVDHIITVTQDALKTLQNIFGIPKDKITTIYNGVDLKIFSSKKSKKDLRQKYYFSGNEKIILFVGRITQMKGVAELIEAFEKLIEKENSQHYRLIICGKGEYDWVYKHIHHYSQITLTGNLSKEQLYEFYTLADVGVVPSYAEQCSYTAIEMMANELPIIVTDVGGLNELVDTDTGVKAHLEFSPEKLVFNTDDLAEKIRFVLSNLKQARKRAKNAFLKVKNNFTADMMTTQTLQVYEKLLTSEIQKYTSQVTDLVSVVIPCYNGEKYLKRCIESVLCQTYENIEIIVVDDASEDKTQEILSQIKDSRLKVIRNTMNRGIVYGLNRGIKEAKGEYIARIDADDIMQVDRIALQVDFLEKNLAYAMVGSNHIVIDEQENVLQYVAYPESNTEIQLFKYFLNPFSHPTVMFRSFIFKEFLYSEDYPYCEDYALWFDILEKYKVGNIPQYTTYYRLHKENLSLKKQKVQQESALELVLDKLEEAGIALSTEEMKLHTAILFRKMKLYLNTPEKGEELKHWIDKLMKIFKIKDSSLQEILLMYCKESL